MYRPAYSMTAARRDASNSAAYASSPMLCSEPGMSGAKVSFVVGVHHAERHGVFHRCAAWWKTARRSPACGQAARLVGRESRTVIKSARA